MLIVHIDTVYFHCSKAIVRSKLWDEKTKIDRKSLPSTGTILAELSQGKLGGEAYDRDAPERIKAQLILRAVMRRACAGHPRLASRMRGDAWIARAYSRA